MDALRLLVFTALWTALWVSPLPARLRRFELAAGLIPFGAFGLRVFAGFFVGVPADDPVLMTVGPLLDWVNGRVGTVPYQWVLDGAVGIGLVWLALAFEIPRRSRIATAWIMPSVAILSLLSLQVTGEPIEITLASRLPAVLLALVVAGLIGSVIRWTPSSISVPLRRKALMAVILILPGAVAVGSGVLAACAAIPGRQAAVESVVALTTGLLAGLAGWWFCQFERTRSRLLFAMSVGVAVGAIVARNSAATGGFVPPPDPPAEATLPQVASPSAEGDQDDGILVLVEGVEVAVVRAEDTGGFWRDEHGCNSCLDSLHHGVGRESNAWK